MNENPNLISDFDNISWIQPNDIKTLIKIMEEEKTAHNLSKHQALQDIEAIQTIFGILKSAETASNKEEARLHDLILEKAEKAHALIKSLENHRYNFRLITDSSYQRVVLDFNIKLPANRVPQFWISDQDKFVAEDSVEELKKRIEELSPKTIFILVSEDLQDLIFQIIASRRRLRARAEKKQQRKSA